MAQVSEVLQRLSVHGVTLKLSANNENIIVIEDKEKTAKLTDKVWNSLVDLKKTNHKVILEYLQNYNSAIVEKVRATNELAQMLMGSDVELFDARIIELSELAVVFEVDGVRWQVEADEMPSNRAYQPGDIFNITGQIDGLLIASKLQGAYVRLGISKIEYLRTEAF